MPIPAAFLLVALADNKTQTFCVIARCCSPTKEKVFPRKPISNSLTLGHLLWKVGISCSVFSNRAPTCTCWASVNLEGSRDNKNYIRRVLQNLNSLPIKTEIAKVGHIINSLLTRLIFRGPEYINKRNDKRNINLTSHQVQKYIYHLQLFRILPLF